jgi:predicted HAD superfamily Cof-like phosphohydrolase
MFTSLKGKKACNRPPTVIFERKKMDILLSKIDKVAEFHESFRIGNNTQPTHLTAEEQMLRFNLMKEENEEYLEAAQRGDMVEVADALGDQLYILLGTILRHGLQHKIAEVFDEIHRSNMSKLDENGQPIYREDGKVMKGTLYFKPDIRSILELQP